MRAQAKLDTILRTGQIVAAKYRVDRLIAEGGMAAVWAGVNEHSGKRVALKVMLHSFAANREAVELFRREALAASKVNHPNVVNIMDVIDLEASTCIVMEMLDGETFGSYLARNGPLSPETTLKVLAAALAGIPLLFGGVGSFVAGVISSRLILGRASSLSPGHGRTGRMPVPLARRVTLVRRAFGFIGLTGAGALLMTSFYIRDPLLAMLSMGLASFFNDTTLPGSWTTCMDVGGKYAGTVSGSMNMLGNFGGMAGPVVVGYILSPTDSTTQDWQLAFFIFAAVYFLGAICWLFIDPVTPLEEGKTAVMSRNRGG